MGDHWTESTSPLSAGRVDPSVLNVVGLVHSQKANKPGQSFRTFFLGRRWQDGGKFMLRKLLHVDQSNGLQGLLAESENSAPATSSVVSRRSGSVKFSPAFVPTVSVVNYCQDNCFQSTILEGEFDVAVRDVNGLVLHTIPVPDFFNSHPGSSLRYYHSLPAWVYGIIDKGSVLDMGGSQKSSGGKLLWKATAGVAGESERTNLTTNGTNSPIEKEIEKYVCFTFATDTPDWWINPDPIGLYFKEALAYFSGSGPKRFDTLIPTESSGVMESSTELGGLSKSFSVKTLALEEHRLRCQQEFLQKEELVNDRGNPGVLSGYVNWEQNDAAIRSESEGSYETGSSLVFDESFYMGPTQLEAELQATSDAIEEMEGKVAIKLMVAEAVLRGIVRAVEVDASEAVEVSETELLKVKHELQGKDSTVTDLISTLKKKEEELVKLVEESRRKERRLVMDMLTERERILGKIKESEKYVAQKEKELLKMAEHLVELSLNLAAESKRVNVLEKQIKESKEAELKKGRELLAMMEKAEQFRTEKESMVEMVRREARLKELRLTESLADKEEVLSQRLETIRTLEAAEQQLREEVDARNQKDLDLTKTLVEKERILGQQLEAITTIEDAGQRLREEVDTCRRKEQQLSKSLDEKEKVLNQQHDMIRTLEIAEQKLREEVNACRDKELCLSETLVEKEGVLSQQLEAIDSLENTQQKLREELGVRFHKEQQLTESLIDQAKVVSQHLQTIKTLETSEQQLRRELADRSQKELQLTQSLVENESLKDEVVALKEKVFQYTGAVQLAQDELQAQSWKHEIETVLIMTALQGRAMDLEREVNLLGEESARNEAEMVSFRSRTLQKRSLEMSNLRSSKQTLEAKLSDAQTALEAFEQIAKKQEEELENKDFSLEKAKNRIAQLEHKLLKKEKLSEGFKKELEEMNVREENLQKQRQVLESEVQKVRQDLDGATLREQELRGRESHLQSLVEDLEETIWRVEFENMFVNTYMENSSQDVLNVAAEVNKRAAAGAERIIVLQLELEAAGVELCKRREEIDRLVSENLDLSPCVERLEFDLLRNAQDIAEARAGMQKETAQSRRLKAHISELQSQLDGLREELEGKLSLKQEEAIQLLSILEESKWQSEVENLILMGLAEGCNRKLMESLARATEEIRLKSEDISFLRCEIEELRQELRAFASDNTELKTALASKTQERCKFKTDFVLQNAIQRDALLQAQTQAEEASKKIEELRRVQLEEALAEERWKHQFEMGIVSTVMSEAGVAYATRSVERESQSARSPHEQSRGGDSKKADTSKDVSSRTDPMVRFVERKSDRAKMELKANKTPLTKLDLLVRENDELRREKEQLLTQKTEELYKLKREFYKELEKMKVDKKDPESDGLQKESPKPRGASNPRLQAVTEPEIMQTDDSSKVEMVVAHHERKLSEMKAVWDSEKSNLQRTLSQREDEIKELVTRWSLESQAQQNDHSEKLEKVLEDHERKVSELREQWGAEKAALLVSSRSQAQQNDDSWKLQKLVADHEREVSEIKVLWNAEISALLESLSQREDEIKELLSKLSSQPEVQPNDDCAKLEKVVADYNRNVSEMRASWDVEKSAIEEQIKELMSELTQALEKEREYLRRQASLEENLATLENERTQFKTLHQEEIGNSVATQKFEVDVKTCQLSEAVRDAQEKSKQVKELDDEVRQMRDEVSVLRSEMSLVRKQVEIEFTGEIQALVAALHQLERGVTQRTKQHNLRLHRAHCLLNHLTRQCRLLVSGDADHTQNLQNLQKAEAEVDLLGDEVDALMDVLEKVYTVLSHYHPVIQHYPGLADLAKVVRNEVLQRLRDSDDVQL